MSPEQATGGRELDERSDIYSLGAVAYYLLTGRPPFDGESGIGVMIAHARDPVVPPSLVRAGIPEDLERVVLRCLAKDPAERFPDAESLERALGECACAADWDQDRAAGGRRRRTGRRAIRSPSGSTRRVAGPGPPLAGRDPAPRRETGGLLSVAGTRGNASRATAVARTTAWRPFAWWRNWPNSSSAQLFAVIPTARIDEPIPETPWTAGVEPIEPAGSPCRSTARVHHGRSAGSSWLGRRARGARRRDPAVVMEIDLDIGAGRRCEGERPGDVSSRREPAKSWTGETIVPVEPGSPGIIEIESRRPAAGRPRCHLRRWPSISPPTLTFIEAPAGVPCCALASAVNPCGES